jgi:dephospho-CoA kinase
MDLLAREAVAPGTSGLSRIAEHFGRDEVIKPDGTLNREALGRIIFGNDKKRKELNGIVHPEIRRLCAVELVRYWLKGESIVVVDSPLLIETGLWKFCGWVVVVWWSVFKLNSPFLFLFF